MIFVNIKGELLTNKPNYGGISVKKSFLTKLAAVALVMGTVVTALPAGATTQYCSQVMSGTNDKSSRVSIGSGTRYFHATAKAGTGDAYAKEYVSSGADKTVASFTVKNVAGKDTPEYEFTASDSSKYYMRWSGYSDASKARLYIDDSAN